jgi:hypothetical protein
MERNEQRINNLVRLCKDLAITKGKENVGSYVFNEGELVIKYNYQSVNGSNEPMELEVLNRGIVVLYASCLNNNHKNHQCIDGLVPHLCYEGPWEEKILSK